MEPDVQHPQYAGALLITPDGGVVLQQRDNKPGIMNPGQITTFGGAVEEGETPDQAILRELSEELGLKNISPKFYRLLHKNQTTHGEDREMHIYLVDGIDPTSLTIREGAGYIVVSEKSQIPDLPLTKLALEILNHYLNN